MTNDSSPNLNPYKSELEIVNAWNLPTKNWLDWERPVTNGFNMATETAPHNKRFVRPMCMPWRLTDWLSLSLSLQVTNWTISIKITITITKRAEPSPEPPNSHAGPAASWACNQINKSGKPTAFWLSLLSTGALWHGPLLASSQHKKDHCSKSI